MPVFRQDPAGVSTFLSLNHIKAKSSVVLFSGFILNLGSIHTKDVRGTKNGEESRRKLAQCALQSLFAPRKQSKPMNCVPDVVHRGFQLNEHSSREDPFDCRAQLQKWYAHPYSPAKEDPRTGGNLRPELGSPRAARPAQGHAIKSETRRVSFLSPAERGGYPPPPKGQECPFELMKSGGNPSETRRVSFLTV